MQEVVVIGGGAAGCIAALEASKNARVTILEKKDRIGNKLRITGKGRCNLTFKGDFEYFRSNILDNGKFMYSSFNLLNNENLIKFVNELGVKTKEERGNRIFLESDNAEELVLALYNKLKENNVEIKLNFAVKSVEKTNEKFIIHSLDGKTIKADKCIIATGGKSYPGTGSTGDGYEIAKSFGHSIKEIKPGLVPIKSEDLLCKNMQGLTLKNVNIVVLENDKKIYSDFGEMMFAHFGLTGPIVLSASSKITRVDNLKEKIKNKEIKILLDLKPALTEEVLDKRICRDFEKYINKEFKNSLNELLPQKIIPEIIEKTGIDKNKKVNQITKEERERLVKTIKAFDINITGLMPVDVGIVTVGGVSLKEVNPKTLESKIVDDLYIIGEVLDLDAYTGGFNLQIAFSTGYACGHFIANEN